MFENLRRLYIHYGGIAAIAKSSYFWIAVILTLLSYRSIPRFEWSDKALSVMPSLTGFTIAAFAIIFAILNQEMLEKLMALDDKGRSPIAAIAASIGHAVFIQVSALIFSIGSEFIDLSTGVDVLARWMKSLECSPEFLFSAVDWLSFSLSAVGIFLTYYGVLLVLAAILSIVRMQLLVANATKSKPPVPPTR
ncbi:hypothetical protein [Sinisalibacter lacisalsi]|uniref:hypothetical protein n=1 Tax=Sinisalibacter lacisalsi TaxID=1526570 RepID=UPI0016653213|nr:hypothetical protein [Sinisalibacter lacisalsi]